MPSRYQCQPLTAAEQANAAQCSTIDFLLRPPWMRTGTSWTTAPAFDAYADCLDGSFELDDPLRLELVTRLAATDADQAVQLLAAGRPAEELLRPPETTNASLDRLMAAGKDSLIGGGNRLGNLSAMAETALRAAWRKQAMSGFKTLLSGDGTTSVSIGKHIKITSVKIGKGGELRKGARLMVRITKLPMAVIHSLPAPMVPRAGGSFGSIRIGARDLQRIEASANALAGARLQSSTLLRAATSKVGVGVLAFGPSAAIDLYDSASWSSDGLAVDWQGLAVRSAKSQSGNALGVAFGSGAVAGAVALGLVAAVGWPVVLVGLGAGIAAQVAWGWSGADQATADFVANKLK